MKDKKHKIRVGISVGDTNGIGSEIIIKALDKKGVLEFFTPIIFGSTKLFSFNKNLINSQLNINGIRSSKDALPNKVNVVNIWQDNLDIQLGEPTKESGKRAFESLQYAVESLKKDEIDVLVTAPINKETIQSDIFNFPGHTEYLESLIDGDALMFMIHPYIKIGLVTNHIPVKEISSRISKNNIMKKARLMHKTLVQDFQISKPKIAVLGLNPHNGDNGLIGNEEKEKIEPAIQQLKEEGILAFGPFPADGFFGSNQHQNYDAVLAMYHDQGLIPFKNITFGRGVNFTAGLEKIRTSPDHGVAYHIAGRNQASEESFLEAVFSAIKIFNTRNEFLNLTETSLQKQEYEIILKNNRRNYPTKEK